MGFACSLGVEVSVTEVKEWEKTIGNPIAEKSSTSRVYEEL